MTIRTLTTSGLVVASAFLSTGLAQAHTAIVDHAHPHEATHAYAGLETIALASIAAIIGISAFAVTRKLETKQIRRQS